MYGVFRPSPAISGIILLTSIFIEIASIIIVGRAIGVFATLTLLVLGIIVGVSLFRWQSAHLLARMQSNLNTGQIQPNALADNAFIMLAAFLLIIPGFVSDIIALLLLLPPVRALLRKFFSKRFSFPQPQQNTPREDNHTIDLDAEDYHSVDPENSPWKPNNQNRLPPQ